MKRSGLPPKSGQPMDPIARAKVLADRMAKVLDREDVGDVTIAIAMLTSGVIHQYAENAAEAEHLIGSIRRLEDCLIASAFQSMDQSIDRLARAME